MPYCSRPTGVRWHHPNGNIRFRKTWFGRLVLQVEHSTAPNLNGVSTLVWSDANEYDLMDLRQDGIIPPSIGVANHLASGARCAGKETKP